MSKKNKSIQQLPSPEIKQTTAVMSIHSVKQQFPINFQPSFFNTPEEFTEEYKSRYGITLEGNINRYGVELTPLQDKVKNAILSKFKHSKEQGLIGNLPAKSKEEYLQEYYGGKEPEIFKNIFNIPRIKIIQTELFRLCGCKEYTEKDTGYKYFDTRETSRILEGLSHLAEHRYCFYYLRAKQDLNGKYILDENKKYIIEEVRAVGTLFTLYTIAKEGRLSHYEIEPSPIYLDQIQNYFMIIPLEWEDEVKRITKVNRVGSYTMRFLLWLRLQFETKRRNPFNKDYTIKKEYIAIAKEVFNMPESKYKKNRKSTMRDIEKAYKTAVKVGYLLNYKIGSTIDTLVLNPDYYYSPQKKFSE